jgi:hypothetical protein
VGLQEKPNNGIDVTFLSLEGLLRRTSAAAHYISPRDDDSEQEVLGKGSTKTTDSP